MNPKATAKALGRASVAIAALAVGGWAFRKWRDKRASKPSYPEEAAPAVPASETSSPS